MKSKAAPPITDYWGKARPSPGALAKWHPLAYHGLDVAAAGHALLTARPQLLTALAIAARQPEHVIRSWFLMALALHDIGKYADCFQCKAPEHWHHQAAWQGKQLAADLGHGGHGAGLWRDNALISLGIWGTTRREVLNSHGAFTHWLNAIFGHHGRPIEPRLLGIERICEPARADAWSYAKACIELFSPQVPANDMPFKEARFRQTTWFVAGLAMLSDWIGSNQVWFPYEEPIYNLSEYWQLAKVKADVAISESGLLAPRVAADYGLGDALPGIKELQPTALQAWAAGNSGIQGQSLVIIEDLTGAGKTEAGLIVAHRLMQAGTAEGLYWALPTMATADALYRRMAESYGRLFAYPQDASLVLAHGSREFNDIFKKSIRLEPTTAGAETPTHAACDDDVSATASCARWLSDDRRKTFLADVGVGTIDQAVLAILPSKHQAMRLAALSRRVLVIDEIHSLDAYQNVLTEALLMFHAAFGGSAILVSATLTQAARQKLTNAFAKGAGWNGRTIGESNFPLATTVDASGVRSASLTAVRGSRRDLPVVRLDGPHAALDVLKQAHADRRGAIWIRNTVQDALDAYQDVKAAIPDANLDLFHARFTLGDRLAIEKCVLENFGKASEGKARERIVISTQVCEQSIDADWDVMITDLAPIDLIIQRAGRLHRHDHRPTRPDPVLHVVGPAPNDDAGPKWYENAFPRGAYVYPHHGQLWLTMKTLLDARGLPLKSENPRTLLERVYGSSAFPAGLEQPASRAEGASMSARAVGRMNALDLNKGYVHHAGDWASDTRTPTRLGDPTRTLRLARWDGQRLTPWRAIADGDARKAWRLSEVSVLARRVVDIAPPDAALESAIADEVATWPDSYDPPLLVPLQQDGDDWTAKAVALDQNEHDVALTLRYSAAIGLRFEP